MRVLLVSKDKTLFEDDSRSIRDIIKAAEVVEQVHVIVLTKSGDPYENKSIAGKIFLYPTKSSGYWRAVRDAMSIAELQLMIGGQVVADLVVADGPFRAGLAGYLLSRRFKRSLLINIFETMEVSLLDDDGFRLWAKEKIANHILPRCQGVRVPTHAVGEAVCADFPKLLERIYILDKPVELDKTVSAEPAVDLKTKYPQFNLFVVTVVDRKDRTLERRLRTIASTLRMRYVRIGTVVVDNQGLYKHTNEPFLVWESKVKDLAAYYKSAHIYMDVSEDSKPGRAITEAALTGCPIVAVKSDATDSIVKDGENGFIANPDNPPEFCGRIAEVLETPGLRERFKLFRYEIEQMHADIQEEYGTGLVSIWQRVASSSMADKDAIEAAAKGLVHTLTDSRTYMARIAEKIDRDLKSVGDRFNFEDGRRRKPLQKLDIHDETKAFDVDTVIKNI